MSVQEIEGTFHCVMAVQEAVPVDDNPHLRTLFSPDILNRIPSSGSDRIRRTVVILIGEFLSCRSSDLSKSHIMFSHR